MKLLRLNQLPDNRKGHIMTGLIQGEYINKGTMSYKPPGLRVHDDEDIHVHDDAEVFIILQGKAWMEFDDRDVPLTVGDVLIVEPGENHHLVSDEQEPCVNLWFHAGDNPHPDNKPPFS
jgi:mannose-6-phosphate isomerase-like protein (cupin superfamily)